MPEECDVILVASKPYKSWYYRVLTYYPKGKTYSHDNRNHRHMDPDDITMLTTDPGWFVWNSSDIHPVELAPDMFWYRITDPE